MYRDINSTALTIRDRGTNWIMGYPATTKSVANIKPAVIDFKGSETVSHWYSDGAYELHAACRELDIRHDQSDPHRHETNGVIEITNRTIIDGTRTCLF